MLKNNGAPTTKGAESQNLAPASVKNAITPEEAADLISDFQGGSPEAGCLLKKGFPSLSGGDIMKIFNTGKPLKCSE